MTTKMALLAAIEFLLRCKKNYALYDFSSIDIVLYAAFLMRSLK